MHIFSPWRKLAARSLAAIQIDLYCGLSHSVTLNWLTATSGGESMNSLATSIRAIAARGFRTLTLVSVPAAPASAGSPALWKNAQVLAASWGSSGTNMSTICWSGKLWEDASGAWKRSSGNSAMALASRGFLASPSRRHYGFMGGDGQRLPRLLIVQPRVHPRAILKAKLMEAMRLVDSLEELRGDDGPVAVKEKRRQTPFVLVQSPRSRSSSKRVSAGGYFGAGTIDTVRVHVDLAASQEELDAIFVNATLSGVQQRNLEAAWGKPVLDRVGLIIEIFGAHAQTKEAKLQVELAALDYQKTRLVRVIGKGGARLGFGMGGEAEVVSARGRASGAIGGAGETELQLQRRRIGQRRTRLKKLLADVRRTRSLHRASRQRHASGGSSDVGLPLVAVVGYTNAGKSSMVAALSQSNVYVDDRLFATLDSRVRSVILPSGKKVLLSDTVGFISDLPVQLVEAFQATLQEVVEADLLLHVIDSSASNADEQREAVLQVLRDIGVPQTKLDTCMVEAWNKVDLLEDNSEIYSHFNVPMLEETKIEFPEDSEGQFKPCETAEGIHDMRDLGDDDSKVDPMSEEKQKPTVVAGFRWSQDGITRLTTSAATGIGLGALLDTLDKRLAQVAEKTVH